MFFFFNEKSELTDSSKFSNLLDLFRDFLQVKEMNLIKMFKY